MYFDCGPCHCPPMVRWRMVGISDLWWKASLFHHNWYSRWKRPVVFVWLLWYQFMWPSLYLHTVFKPYIDNLVNIICIQLRSECFHWGFATGQALEHRRWARLRSWVLLTIWVLLRNEDWIDMKKTWGGMSHFGGKWEMCCFPNVRVCFCFRILTRQRCCEPSEVPAWKFWACNQSAVQWL